MSHIINGSGKHFSFQEIHSYTEGKLYKYDINKVDKATKSNLFNCLIELISKHANENIKNAGITGIKLIYKDIEAPPNFSNSDNILADDVLAEICILISKQQDAEVIMTAVNHICEQMSDMLVTHGTCPVGRVSRLYQIFMFLRDM